ncbi:glutamyl-tRNA synthetase [Natranaerovirga pectinivora]|uniref:Glutamate--tRNA ligase n=1 Tax=Natranaerovirga pectinivora TaxID=682400 RepID=A0A4R3ML64_9FIRM|nr:glutamate--tRNA ligase [Natranaerovirga pectinivora]TCT15436.1 glutamyl-tRNA synthetase [Natranaerovirga pectinivora]
MSKTVRTRFAPSPTGKMHVGNLRTALYAYLIAKHEAGDFLLRIEDTDQERYVEGAIDIIYNTLKRTGLVHDEGPDKDGGVGPYIQSDRQKAGIYTDYANKLIEKKEAYYCFCTKERLDALREEKDVKKETFRYDKKCVELTAEEVQENIKKGIPYVIRQDNPTDGTTTFEDEIYGRIKVDNSELDDMVLIKSDGFPTYNFANVVDDYLMGITHIVRGNEYLSSSPKYNRLYEAFGWEVPTYVHCPLITNEEHQKLSKRSGHSSYEDLLEQGFLTETIVNFVALLGWSPEGNEELFSLVELVKRFDYKKINKSPAVFDMKKLRWMNGEYIKKMDCEDFYKIALPYVKSVVKKDLNCREICDLVKMRVEVLTEIPELLDFLDELPDYEIDLYIHKKMKTTPELSLQVLNVTINLLKAQEYWTKDSLHDLIMDFAKESGMKNGQVLWPLRTALSGKPTSPGGAFDLMEILGKEESLCRLEVGIKKLQAAVAQ